MKITEAIQGCEAKYTICETPLNFSRNYLVSTVEISEFVLITCTR